MKTFIVYTITYGGEIMYVGKTSNMANRKTMHKTQIGNPRYSAIPVDADLSKIEFNVVAEFDNEADALKYEDQLILQYNTISNGWNKYRSGLIKASDIKAYMQDYNRDYYQAHMEDKTAYQRDYRETNREHILARQREYDEAHRVEKAAYYQAHREEINAKRRERRERKKAEAIASAS